MSALDMSMTSIQCSGCSAKVPWRTLFGSLPRGEFSCTQCGSRFKIPHPLIHHLITVPLVAMLVFAPVELALFWTESVAVVAATGIIGIPLSLYVAYRLVIRPKRAS